MREPEALEWHGEIGNGYESVTNTEKPQVLRCVFMRNR
jgi:hypothetical protein